MNKLIDVLSNSISITQVAEAAARAAFFAGFEAGSLDNWSMPLEADIEAKFQEWVNS